MEFNSVTLLVTFKTYCRSFSLRIDVISLSYSNMVLPPEVVARIIALIEDGQSQRYAARVQGIPETTVRRAVQRFRETGSYGRRPGSGRPRATEPGDGRFMFIQTLRNRSQSAVETSQRLREARGTHVSERTVRRRLAELNLRSRVPASGPQLTPAHRRARLNFCREHAAWTVDDWASVLFSDESRFSLYGADGRVRVWRRRGERFAQCNITGRVMFGGGSVMVWGGISLEAKTELHVFRRPTLDAGTYITDILEDYVVPFAPFVGPNFLLMHDNARPHVAHVVRDYLNEVGIGTLDWPARSPDLNPIEHLWDQLGTSIRRQLNPPRDLQELRTALEREWDQIPQVRVANLIRSMPRRVQDVIRARGGNTRY